MSLMESACMTVSTTHTFRALIVVAVVLHLLLWLGPVFGPGRLPVFDVWLLNFDGYGASMAYSPVLYWCLFASWLLVFAGLFFYVAAARAGLLVLFFISLSLGLVWGVRVLTPYEAAASPLLAAVDGIVITMAYSSPVRAEFDRRR